MTRSPNDQDPPDYVTGDTEMQTFYELIYEKYGDLIEDVDALLDEENWRQRVTATTEGNISELITFVANEAHKKGRDDAQSDMGEYIDVLEQEALGAVRMVLDAATEEGHELSDSEICDAIDWDLLRKIDKKFGRKE